MHLIMVWHNISFHFLAKYIEFPRHASTWLVKLDALGISLAISPESSFCIKTSSILLPEVKGSSILVFTFSDTNG